MEKKLEKHVENPVSQIKNVTFAVKFEKVNAGEMGNIFVIKQIKLLAVKVLSASNSCMESIPSRIISAQKVL